ncbi:MAG: hypothetical protein J6K17_12490 [Oscillospiraceae bacterium]|nr:hypothetical protein [Oscillospiraceae bacterium]
MKTVKKLKEDIASRMKRCWGECCALFFVSSGIVIAAVFAIYLTMDFLITFDVISSAGDPVMLAVAAAIAVVMWIITQPYNYGMRWYRLQQVRGHSVHAKSVFSCYFSFKRMMQVYRISAVLALKKLVLVVPLAAFLGTSIFLIMKADAVGGSVLYNVIVVILLMLSVVMCIAYSMITLKYAAAPYLFALGHDRPVDEIIKESVSFMKGKNGYMAEAMSNCAFMLVPCVIVFSMVFVIPRMMMLYTSAINEIIEEGFKNDRLVGIEQK